LLNPSSSYHDGSGGCSSAIATSSSADGVIRWSFRSASQSSAYWAGYDGTLTAGTVEGRLAVDAFVGLRIHIDYPDAAGLPEARFYLADHQQQVLREVTGLGPDARRGGEDLPIDHSPAGQAYITGVAVRADTGPRYWVPILDGAERLGVLHVTWTGDPSSEGSTSSLTSFGSGAGGVGMPPPPEPSPVVAATTTGVAFEVATTVSTTLTAVSRTRIRLSRSAWTNV
jgi:hypothetical protein